MPISLCQSSCLHAKSSEVYVETETFLSKLSSACLYARVCKNSPAINMIVFTQPLEQQGGSKKTSISIYLIILQ